MNTIVDGTRENFQQLVLDNSRKGAVLVNYWTPKVGPCLMLWETLEALSQEYQGRFLLVNINTETQHSLVRDNGITSVPTVKVYNRGNIVDSIHGAQSAASLRNVIDKYVAPAQNSEVAKAINAYQSGHTDHALNILAEARKSNPDDMLFPVTAMKLLLREKRYDELEKYATELPDSIQAKEDIFSVQIHGLLLNLAQQVPSVEVLDQHLRDNPQDLEAALQRAAVALTNNDPEHALEYLLYILQQDRNYADDLPRKAMLTIFSLLGHEHEYTRSFQKRLIEILQC